MQTLSAISTRVFATVLSLVCLAAVGCQSTGAGGSAARVDRNQPVQVVKGMLAEDLIAALGEPTEIRQPDPPVEGAEIWLYRRDNANVEMKVTGSKEIPYIDPVTGAQRSMIEPIYQAETSTSKEEILILMADGQVQAWKVNRRENRNYN